MPFLTLFLSKMRYFAPPKMAFFDIGGYKTCKLGVIIP